MTIGNSAAGDGARNAGGVRQGPRYTPPIAPADPAVQVVESAYQILTMIGANPRAIRPLLAQRRLTKDAVLAAAASLSGRVELLLGPIEARTATATVDGSAAADGATAPAVDQSVAAVERRFLTSLREHATRVSEVYATL